MQRLIILWLTLSLLALPVMVRGEPLPAADDAPARMLVDAGCDGCLDEGMEDNGCSMACAAAACVMSHCALFLPVSVGAAPAVAGRQHRALYPGGFYRSHLPGLPVRPPIV
jgi:hypothetical protein